MLEIEPVNEYELPVSYGDNRVVLMAKDPHWLFAYWDIDPAVTDTFRTEFGNEVWYRSAPFLKIKNITKNKEFHIRINDFSSSWYVNVNELDCLYTAEVGRKLGDKFFISLAGSNITATSRDKTSSNTNALFVNYKEPGKAALKSNKEYPDNAEGFSLDVPGNGPSSIEAYSSNLFEALISSEGLQGTDNR